MVTSPGLAGIASVYGDRNGSTRAGGDLRKLSFEPVLPRTSAPWHGRELVVPAKSGPSPKGKADAHRSSSAARRNRYLSWLTHWNQVLHTYIFALPCFLIRFHRAHTSTQLHQIFQLFLEIQQLEFGTP